MILSASRRTDIPAFFSDWFFNRLKEGFVLVPNPYNPKQISRINLSPDGIDCIVFWTKNPAPMTDRLKTLDKAGFSYYFQFTLNPYGSDTEPGLPPKEELIKSFVKLSAETGRKRVLWRYDPIFITEKYSADWHKDQFRLLCRRLSSCTDICTISFIDIYRNISSSFRAMSQDEIYETAESFSETAAENGIDLLTCAEETDLSSFGIKNSSCIDAYRAEQASGCKISLKPGKPLRKGCRCAESTDIGIYDTCMHGCSYCYASQQRRSFKSAAEKFDVHAPMLTGFPDSTAKIYEKTVRSAENDQLQLTVTEE